MLGRRLRVLAAIFALASWDSLSAAAAHFWLSASNPLSGGQLVSGSMPPATAAGVPQIGHSLTAPSGSLYIWARPDVGKTLEMWSLRVVSSNASVVRLTTSSVAAFNPILGTTGGGEPLDVRRWENMSEPTAPVAPTSQGASLLQTMQGMSVIGVNEVGVGIGPQGAGGVYADPFYHAASNAWLLAQVNYVPAGQEGASNVFLQIGSFGLSYLGETAAAGYARLGATSDPLLVGPTGRQVNSLTPEAVISVSATAPSADFNEDSLIDGADFLTWQRNLTAHGGAAGLALWKDQFGTAATPAITPIPEPNAWRLGLLALAAGAMIGRFRLGRSCLRYLILLTAIACWDVLPASKAPAADVTSLWDSTTGVWSDSTKWDSLLFPHNGNGGLTYNATVNGGAVTLDQDVEIEGLTFGAGTITGDFDLTLNAASTWTSGTMSGLGTTTIASTKSLSLVGATFNTHSLRRLLVNDGTTTWSGGYLDFNNGTFQNNGTFTDSRANSDVSTGGGVNAFNNFGTYTKLNSNTTNFVNGVAFNNSGLVNVQSGSLALTSQGTHSGDFVIGAALLTLHGSQVFEGTNSITGAGVISLRGGTIDFNGVTTVDAQFDLDAFTVNMGGTGTLTLNGAATWTSGTMSGSGQTILSAGNTLLMDPTAVGQSAQLQRSFVNNGAITYAGTRSIGIGSTGTLQNNGTFTVNSGLSASGSGTFQNAGLFTKLGAGTATFNGIDFNNSGLVDVQTGVLMLSGGGTSDGDFAIAAGATLTINGDPYTLQGTVNVTGNGALSFTGGVMQVDGNAVVDATFNFNASTGSIAGSGTLAVNGPATWTAGTMSGSGTTVLASGTISGSAKTLNNRTLRSAGNINWSAGNITTSGARGAIHVPDGTIFTISGAGSKSLNANLQIDAGGTLHHTSTGTTTHTAGTFVNNGLVHVDAGTLSFNSGGSGIGEFVVASGATLLFNGPGHDYNGGLELDGGTLQLTTFTLTNGAVQGTGTVQATTFTNASVVSPGVAGNPVGAIAVTGSYQQSSAGNLALDVQGIGAGDFDTLAISGAASLGGTLAVEAVAGSIDVGEQITIITAASLTPGAEFEDVIVTGLTGVRLVPVYVPAGGSITAASSPAGSALGGSIFASSSSGGASVRLEGYPIGDLNLDGIFNSSDPAAVAADAAALAMAFVDPQGYKAQFAMPGTIMGRVNDDDYFDFDDIHAFRQMSGISMGQMMAAIRAAQAAVPEPSAWALAVVAACGLAARRRGRVLLKHRLSERGGHARHGFTLVELLVVIAIIGVLMGLLLPAIQAARAAARRSQCSNQVRQLALGLQNYASKQGEFPPSARLRRDVDDLAGVSWRVLILPMIEQGAVYEQIRPQANGGAVSWAPRTVPIASFACPELPPPATDSNTLKLSSYAAVAGPGRSQMLDLDDALCGDVAQDGVMYAGSRTKISWITDGTSNTLVIGERLEAQWDWMSGATKVGDPISEICSESGKNIRYPINADQWTHGFYKGDSTAPAGAPKTALLNDLRFASEHSGGAHFGYADGSVHFLPEDVDFTVYQSLATRDGEEIIPAPP